MYFKVWWYIRLFHKGFGRFLRQYKVAVCSENVQYLLLAIVEVRAQQNEILGPLIFLVFGNYVFKNISLNIKLFADDKFLFTEGKSTGDSGTNMSNSLRRRSD